MRILMQRSIVGPAGEELLAGETYDFADDTANALVRAGRARVADDPQPTGAGEGDGEEDEGEGEGEEDEGDEDEGEGDRDGAPPPATEDGAPVVQHRDPQPKRRR